MRSSRDDEDDEDASSMHARRAAAMTLRALVPRRFHQSSTTAARRARDEATRRHEAAHSWVDSEEKARRVTLRCAWRRLFFSFAALLGSDSHRSIQAGTAASAAKQACSDHARRLDILLRSVRSCWRPRRVDGCSRERAGLTVLFRLPHCAFCCFTARSSCNRSACLLAESSLSTGACVVA